MTFIYTPPEPDTHCFDTDENKDVWSYSKYLHVAEVERVRRETIEECAKVMESPLNNYAKVIKELLK